MSDDWQKLRDEWLAKNEPTRPPSNEPTAAAVEPQIKRPDLVARWEKRREKYRAMVAEGLTQPQMAKRLGVQTPAVSRMLAKLGLKARPSPRPPHPHAELAKKREAEVKKMIDRGLTRYEMAAALNINVDALDTFMQRRGLRAKVRLKPGPKPRSPK